MKRSVKVVQFYFSAYGTFNIKTILIVHWSGIPIMEIILIGLKQSDKNYCFKLILYLIVSIAYIKRHYMWIPTEYMFDRHSGIKLYELLCFSIVHSPKQFQVNIIIN